VHGGGDEFDVGPVAIAVDGEPVDGEQVHPRGGGKDPECERGQAELSQEALDLLSHDLGSADVRVESLLSEDDVVVVLAVVQRTTCRRASPTRRAVSTGVAVPVEDGAEHPIL
jgi:hypothetical protein